MGPAPRDKMKKVYPSLKGAQTSPLVTEMGLRMHAQADCRVLRLLRPSSGRALEYSPSGQVKAVAAYV